MAELNQPPQIPPEVWEELEKLKTFQETLTGAQDDIFLKLKPGDRTVTAIDRFDGK